MKFAILVRAARKAQKLTQAQAAKKLGVSTKSVFNWEDDATDKYIMPSGEFVVKMAVLYKEKGQELLNAYVKELGGNPNDAPIINRTLSEIEEEYSTEGFRARASEGDLMTSEEMELALRELDLIRKIRLSKEADRKKGPTNISKGH